MKKSFLIGAFAVLALVACNNKSSDNPSQSSGAADQDSIDKVHGHSHDPMAESAPLINKDSAAAAHGHSHDAPAVEQNSEKEHGHAH